MLSNPRRELRPGMSLAVELTAPDEERLSVPSLAVQWDRAGAFVWKVEGDAVTRVPVEVVRRGSGFVLVEAELQPGDAVVVEGIQRLREGAAVERVGEPGRPAPAAEGAEEPQPGPGEVSAATDEDAGPRHGPGEAGAAGEGAEEPQAGTATPQPRQRPGRGRS